jgi:hypothetical protein
MREDLERDLQALVTDSTLRQAESVAAILHDVAADRRGRALGAAASWSRRFVSARAGRVLGPLGFAPPVIADTPTVRRRAEPRVAEPAFVRPAGVTNKALKGASIIATISGPIARAAA